MPGPNTKKLQLLSNMQRELARLEKSMTKTMDDATNGNTKTHLDTVKYNTLEGIKGWLSGHSLTEHPCDTMSPRELWYLTGSDTTIHTTG
jgi:hypothetical protein